MIKAVVLDKPLIIDLLTRSFQKNKSVNYIVKYSRDPKKGIYALMDYSFELCFRYGEVWISDNRKACALILFPHLRRTTLRSVLLDIGLIVKAIGLRGLPGALKREAKIKAIQPKTDMVYLWFIGVEPDYQHRGIGSELLAEVIADASRRKLPVYLETSTLKNLPWYKRFGFEIYDQLVLDYTLFFLKRIPG